MLGLFAKTYHSDTYLRSVAFQMVDEGTAADLDFASGARGVEQIGFAVLDDDKAGMGYVKVFHRCDKGHGIAVDKACFRLLVGEVGCLDVGKAVAAVADLDITYAGILRAIGQSGIFVAVGTHVVDSADDVVDAREEVGGILDVAPVDIVDHPVADVVETGAVAVELAAAIAQAFEIVDEVAPRRTAFAHGVGHREDCFEEGGAVKLVDVDGHEFRGLFEGRCDVGFADKFACDIAASFARGLELMRGCINEDFVDAARVVGFVMESYIGQGRRIDTEQRHDGGYK